jgi:agmatinase
MKELSRNKNFLGIEKQYSNYKDSQIVILQAPLEKTVTYGKGTANGPAEIIKSSHFVEYYDEELGKELCFEKGIAALEPMNFRKKTLSKSLEEIQKEVDKHIKNKKFVVTLGGEHTISYSAIKAFCGEYQDISILHIDAHSDLRNSYEGLKCSHATFMARVAEFNKNIVQIGVRAECTEEAEFKKMNGIKTFYAREIKMRMYGDNWQELVARNLSDHVYITFDVDAFDPSLLPSTGTPEPGGFLWDEILSLIKIVGIDKKIVGFDVTELAPAKSHPASNYIAAKLVYKMLNYAFVNKK